MCRHYVRELRRSVMIGTPDNEANVTNASKRSSALLDAVGHLDTDDAAGAGPSMFKTDMNKKQDAKMSAFLRDEVYNGKKLKAYRKNRANQAPGHSPAGSAGSYARQSSDDLPRPSFMSSPQVLTDSNSPEHEVAREDIQASAQNILATYILPDALRQIVLPATLVREITIAIERDGRDDPEVFDAAKDYVFQAMERDAFPGFLRAKALGNLTPPSLFYRLILGLLGEFAGVWAGSTLCMLGASRASRAWVCVI